MRSHATTNKIMSAIKSKGTTPEKILGKAIWALGLRYRKQYKITGRPDFVLTKTRIAIFCDGDFWHGNNWKIRGLKSLKAELKKYSPFWQNKINTNIQRDNNVNRLLKKEGWTVMRFWESSIKLNPDKHALFIYNTHIKKQKTCASKEDKYAQPKTAANS